MQNTNEIPSISKPAILRRIVVKPASQASAAQARDFLRCGVCDGWTRADLAGGLDGVTRCAACGSRLEAACHP